MVAAYPERRIPVVSLGISVVRDMQGFGRMSYTGMVYNKTEYNHYKRSEWI